MGTSPPPDAISSTGKSHQTSNTKQEWFKIRPSIRVVFDKFPLVTYEKNQLPQRAPPQRDTHRLYVFTAPPSSPHLDLSINPTCLKWQVLLKIKGVKVTIVSAVNHASPSGALPFLLPARMRNQPQPQPIPASKVKRWIRSQGTDIEDLGLRKEAYVALVDQHIRAAWLYTLYLDEDNFQALARPLYANQASSNPLIQHALGRQLKAAAEDEILKIHPTIDENELYRLADSAFKSLDALLDRNTFFSENETGGVFDTNVFAYTDLILRFAQGFGQGKLFWKNPVLVTSLQNYPRLLSHRQRMLSLYSES